MAQTKSGAGPGQVFSSLGQVWAEVFQMVPGMILHKIFKNGGKTDLHRHWTGCC